MLRITIYERIENMRSYRTVRVVAELISRRDIDFQLYEWLRVEELTERYALGGALTRLAATAR